MVLVGCRSPMHTPSPDSLLEVMTCVGPTCELAHPPPDESGLEG